MKGTFFNKPLEWNVEIQGESWHQGEQLKGTISVKNHGTDTIDLQNSGVSLAFADIKKVHGRADNALKLEQRVHFTRPELNPSETMTLPFNLSLQDNSPVTDKKSSYYLSYGRNFCENHLQLKIVPKEIFSKIIGLMDTFFRFKLKEYKSTKAGVEFKLLPPDARDMSNIDSLLLTFSMAGEMLLMEYNFQVKKLDTNSTTTKISKDSVKLVRELSSKQYSLGKGMMNQDELLKSIDEVIKEVKLKSVF